MESNKLQKYLLCGMLLLGTLAAAQETKIWTGAVSTNWAEAANWQPTGQPQALSQVLIKKAANGNLPILNGNASVQNLSIELGASLTINGYRLLVAGDFQVGTSGIASDHLVMTNANDEIVINGNALFAARTRLEAGRIILRGNLVQEAINTALQPGATVFVFEGTSPQTVRFQRPGTSNQSFFNNVIVRNASGVSFLSDVHITGLLQLENGGRVQQQDSVGAYFHNQLPRTGGGEYRVRKSYLVGPIVMNEDCALPQPENDLTIVARNALTLNGHRLHVGGSFNVKAYGEQKHLIMAAPTDALLIEGEALFEGFSALTAGTISVRGNLTQKTSSGALQPAGTVFVFDGTTLQTVSFERPGLVNRSFLRDVVIKNPAGVNFASEVYITGRLTLDAGNVAQAAALGTYFTTNLPKIANGAYAIVNSYVAGAIALDANLTLPRADNHLTILPRNGLTLNGHTLRLGGNFTVKVFEDYQHLFMTQATDTLEVNGNAEFQGQSALASGAIIIKGELTQKISGKSLQPSGTHFMLTGTAPQTVNFEKPGTGVRSFFKNLTLRNPAGVTFTSDIFITGQLKLEAGTKLEQAPGFSTNFTSVLPQIESGSYAINNSNIAGALVMHDDLRLQLPATNLTILPKQSLTLNGHTLELGGNFKAGVFSAEKHLIMNHASDRLIVNGDAAFEGLNVLQAGTIVLRGNLLQTISAAALQPEGTAFVFDGKETQIVSFERPGAGNRSYLREVTINPAASVRALTDVFVTGQINNYGRFEVVATRSLFLTNAAGVNHHSGTLVGSGIVNTPTNSFTNDGNVRPGAPSGIMRIAGSYVQRPVGKLTIGLGGLTLAAQYSRLEVSGNAILDGTLELDLTNGYQVSVGDSFRVLTFGSATGEFKQVVSALPKNVELHVRYKATGVDVIAMPSANQAPVAQNDSATTRRNTPFTLNVLRNDVDANEDPLRLTALALANTIGNVEITGDSSITYTPKENFHGVDSFGYTASDGRGGTSTATVLVNVENTNKAPSTFRLLQPQNGIVVNPVAAVLFRWQAAQDAEGDSLRYSVRLFNAVSDTTINHIKTTELRFNGRNFLRGGTIYRWFVRVSDAELTTASVDTFNFSTEIVSSVATPQDQLPTIFALEQNYPNPFNPSTVISLQLPVAGKVNLSIYNLSGQLVKTLVAGEMKAGRHNFTWEATNEEGVRVASG
ncbi:MAG: Ig-like domain-containing protein, partial [candidate division KSB1 bacterium]